MPTKRIASPILISLGASEKANPRQLIKPAFADLRGNTNSDTYMELKQLCSKSTEQMTPASGVAVAVAVYNPLYPYN
jgi:hypothetical protein